MNATATAEVQTGTIKLGRWTYPVQAKGRAGRKTRQLLRNTKRDGSGEWVAIDPADKPKVTLDEDESAEPTAAPKNDVPAINGFTPSEDANEDFEALRVAYRFIFDSFAVTYDDLAAHLDVPMPRAKAIVSVLTHSDNLVVTDRREAQGDVPAETIIQSFHTYDEITVEEAMANFAAAVLPSVRIRRTSGHGGKPGAQVKKPGKSTWKVGDPCPQGHVLDAEAIYTMPSGRKQCRHCRGDYPSNVA